MAASWQFCDRFSVSSWQHSSCECNKIHFAYRSNSSTRIDKQCSRRTQTKWQALRRTTPRILSGCTPPTRHAPATRSSATFSFFEQQYHDQTTCTHGNDGIPGTNNPSQSPYMTHTPASETFWATRCPTAPPSTGGNARQEQAQAATIMN